MIRLSILDENFFVTRIDNIRDSRSKSQFDSIDPVALKWQEDNEYRSWGVKQIGIRIVPQIIGLAGTSYDEEGEEEFREEEIDTSKVVIEANIASSDSLFPTELEIFDDKIVIQFS